MVGLGSGAAWNGVKTTRVPRMTSGDAFQAHAKTFKATVNAYRLFGINRARRDEPALISQPWAENQPIAANKDDQESTHRLRKMFQ